MRSISKATLGDGAVVQWATHASGSWDDPTNCRAPGPYLPVATT